MSEEAESGAPKRKKPAAGKGKGKGGKSKKRFSPVVMGVIAAVAFGAVGIGTWSFAEFGNRGPSAEELKAATLMTEADRWRREEEPHNLTLTTFAVPLLNGKRLPSVPVMIRLQVAGTNGMEALCRGIPRVREATLRVFSPQGIEIRDKNSGIELAPYESFLLEEINRILSGPHDGESGQPSCTPRWPVPAHRKPAPNAGLFWKPKGARKPVPRAEQGRYGPQSSKPYSFQRALTRSQSSSWGITVGG